MIHRIFASDDRFHELHFQDGLNVIVAERSASATDRDTRNGSGKTSVVHIIHFLLGGNAGTESMFRSDVLATWTFGMEFDLGPDRVIVTRSGASHGSVVVKGLGEDEDLLQDDYSGRKVKQSDWTRLLSERLYNLNEEDSLPTVRSLLAYAARNVESGGFNSAFKQNYQQQAGDWQTSVSYLLGLDWRLARRWQEVRDLEAGVKALRRVLKANKGKTSLGSVAELRTAVALAEQRVAVMRSRADNFHVVESFRELEAEADRLTREIASSRDGATMDRLVLQELSAAYEQEQPIDSQRLTRLYESIGLELGDVVKKRFDEVADFHQSVVGNRAIHLQAEIDELERRIEIAEATQAAHETRRRALMDALRRGGAISELNTLQEELASEQASLQALRERFDLADRITSDKNKAKEDKQQLRSSLEVDYREREDQLRSLITGFEAIITDLYEERSGSLVIDAKDTGPDYRIVVDDGRSQGIGHMAIFAFDILTSQLLAERSVGPGFLFHDSHLFDGVDDRQVARALALGSANALPFQYIVTLNSDDVPDDFPQGFSFKSHMVDISLSDASDADRLFGVSF